MTNVRRMRASLYILLLYDVSLRFIIETGDNEREREGKRREKMRVRAEYISSNFLQTESEISN